MPFVLLVSNDFDMLRNLNLLIVYWQLEEDYWRCLFAPRLKHPHIRIVLPHLQVSWRRDDFDKWLDANMINQTIPEPLVAWFKQFWSHRHTLVNEISKMECDLIVGEHFFFNKLLKLVRSCSSSRSRWSPILHRMQELVKNKTSPLQGHIVFRWRSLKWRISHYISSSQSKSHYRTV